MSLLYFMCWFLEVSSVFTQLLSTAVSTHLITYTTASFHLRKFGDDRYSSFVIENKYSAEVRPNFGTRSACAPKYSASAEHCKEHVRCISTAEWVTGVIRVLTQHFISINILVSQAYPFPLPLSPVLTVTCLSYGSLCDFLTFFSSTDLEVTPLDRKMAQMTWFHARTCLLGKNHNCWNPWPPKPPKFAQFWSGLRKISLDFAFNIGGLTSKHYTLYSSSEPNESVIVNRQCRGGKFKYVPKFCIGVQVTWYAQWRFAFDRQFGTECLENAWR